MDKARWESLIGRTVYAEEKHADWVLKNIGELVKVRNDWLMIKYTEGNPGRWFYMKDCRLVIKKEASVPEGVGFDDYILEEELEKGNNN